MNDKEVAEKTKQLERSFAEVLDAAKHQDDQIGRLLVAVAFLTAAVLALASLDSASFVTRDFCIPPFLLPLGLISTVTFLVSMAIAVLLLLAALTAPYGLPGLSAPHDPPKDEEALKRRAGVRSSYIYFLQISALSNEEWHEKWSASPEEIEKEHFRSLIDETHSLAVRTAFQYERSREATTLLTFSFLFFSLAMILVGVATRGDIDTPVYLGLGSRLLLGVVFSAYFVIQLGTPMRRARQTVGSIQKTAQRFVLRTAFVFLVSTLVASAVIFARPWKIDIWLNTMITLTILSLIIYLVISVSLSWVKRIATIASLIGVVTSVIICGLQGLYAGQLLTVVAGAGFLTILSLIAPTYELHMRWRNYGQRSTSTTNDTP